MSRPGAPDPAKLVAGVFTGEKDLIGPLAADLVRLFGPVDLVSAWMPFDRTDYYEPEMGAPLFRRMFSFRLPIRQRMLARIKTRTNALEDRYSRRGRRRVNIDPGYLLPAQFVLATGKPYSHRIYVGRGIYADLTLMYGGGRFRALPWTYPDYADLPIRRFLEQVRRRYLHERKQEKKGLILGGPAFPNRPQGNGAHRV